MKQFLLFIFSIYSLSLFAQAGCTDPQANNYDSSAISNDGSCTYNGTEYIPQYRTPLHNDLEEISAMIRYDNRIFGLADSGNPNAIYEFDTITGNIIQEIELIGTDNEDWESMTIDDLHVYVGDTGNNKHGNRTDLVIYKFPISDLGFSGNIPSNHIECLYFSYEDQTDFTALPKNSTRYDCESIITMGDSIYLFTKDWKKFNTRYYSIPKGPAGNYTATLHDSLFVAGIVTDAAVLGDSIVVLLGSSFTGKGFLELLFDFQSHDVFSGNKRKIVLNQPSLGQPESILLKDDLSGFIATEAFKFNGNNKKQAIFSYSISFWLTNQMVAIQDILARDQKLSIFPNPVIGQSVTVTIPESIFTNDFLFTWIDAAGNQLWQKKISRNPLETTVKCLVPEHLSNGLHYLLLQTGGEKHIGTVKL